MEVSCSEDSVNTATVYCACKFPLAALCQLHADKHLSDSHGFHFTLPLGAFEVITSEEVYMNWKPWLFRLNSNCEILRKKFHLLADGESLINSAYQDLLHFTPGLEHFNMGKCIVPLTDQIEEQTKQLTTKEESHNAEVRTLSQKLQAQEARIKNGLQGLNIKLQDAQGKFQAAQANCLNLQTENESLKKQNKVQATQLAEYRQRLDDTWKIKAQLEAQLGDLNTSLQTWMQRCQTLQTNCTLKDEQCVLLDQEKKAIESQVDQMNRTIVKLNLRNVTLEAELRKWGIATDPPTDFQEPDYSTPQSRAALAKVGPYSDQDDELVLFKRPPVTDDTGVYIGQWNSRDEKHGYGKYLFKSCNIYEGEWRNGQRTGRGRYIWASSGKVYEGDFVQNKREGFGTMYFANGNEYSGAWVNDKKHGVGSYKYGGASQGNQYIGEFLDGNIQLDSRLISWQMKEYTWDRGQQIRCMFNGEVYEASGNKKRGWSSTTYSPRAVEEGAWVNGVLREKAIEQE